MRYFFYGTLIDPEVLYTVIRRPVASADRRPALLRGFRRVYRRGADYPVLVPDGSRAVEGIVVSGLGQRDVALLGAFEGNEYRAHLLPVRLRSGQMVRARVFLPGPGCEASGEDWTIEEWRSRFRRDFLMRIRRTHRPSALADADMAGTDAVAAEP